MNESSYFSDKTAEKVRAAIKELNYAPHSSARGLASQKFNTLGVIVRELAAPFVLDLLSGIERASRQAHCNLLVATRETDDSAASSLGYHNTDGLLVLAGALKDDELVKLHEQGFPVVGLHRSPIPDAGIPVVAVENQHSACEIVSHLIRDHSCRRIAFLRGPETEGDSYLREQGYLQALRDNDIPVDSSLLRFGGFDAEISRNSVIDLLKERPDTDAIFTDDESAVGVYQAVEQLGMRIPEDIKVAGFDDDYVASRLVPRLTTVHSPMKRVGETAVELLMKLIETSSVPIETVLPTHVVIRRSCGCT